MNRTVLAAVLALALTPLAAEARPHGAVAVGAQPSRVAGHAGGSWHRGPAYGGPARASPSWRGGSQWNAPPPRYVTPARYYAPRVVVRPAHLPRPVVVMPVRPLWRPHLFGLHVVPALPLGAVAFTVGVTPYWYAGGEYYAQVAGGYQLVAPPIGAWLSVLPAGAQTYVTGGITFATVNGSYFQWYPEYGSWLVVAPPAY